MDANLDLTQALADVRKAYRLIWLYQRGVVDIITRIAETFEYDFYNWNTSSIGQMPGKSTADPFSKDRPWIWKTLPLYRMSLLYLPKSLLKNVQKTGEWMLEIRVEADTGFEEKDDSEPLPSDFKAVDQTETVLRLYAWYCTKDGKLDWFSDIWNGLDWPEEDDEVTVEDSDVPIRAVRKSFDLSKLPDRASVEQAARDFRKLVSVKLQQSSPSPPPDAGPGPSPIRLRG